MKKTPICPRCGCRMEIVDEEFNKTWLVVECPKCKGTLFKGDIE